ATQVDAVQDIAAEEVSFCQRCSSDCVVSGIDLHAVALIPSGGCPRNIRSEERADDQVVPAGKNRAAGAATYHKSVTWEGLDDQAPDCVVAGEQDKPVAPLEARAGSDCDDRVSRTCSGLGLLGQGVDDHAVLDSCRQRLVDLKCRPDRDGPRPGCGIEV